jgi:hypothetical protein
VAGHSPDDVPGNFHHFVTHLVQLVPFALSRTWNPRYISQEHLEYAFYQIASLFADKICVADASGKDTQRKRGAMQLVDHYVIAVFFLIVLILLCVEGSV